MMKHIGIQTPCSEDRGNMTPNEKGSFCHKCAKQVHDFTNKSTVEIKQIFREMMDQEICGRMTPDQELALNAEFEAWKFQSKRGFQRAMVFSLVVVFGLTLFSCSNEQDRQQIKHIQTVALNAMNVSAGETPDARFIQQQSLSENELLQLKQISNKHKHYLESGCVYDVEHPMIEYAIAEEQQIIYQTQIDGGIGMSMEYRDYLRANEVQVINKQELDENGRLIPNEFAAIAFPNPATTETTFELAVPVTNQFEINLFDTNGKFIQVIHKGEIQRGTFQQKINLSDLNAGIYFVTIFSKDYKETLRISKI